MRSGRYLAYWFVPVLSFLIAKSTEGVELPAVSGLMHHWDAYDPLGTGVQPAAGPVATWMDLAGGNHASVSGGAPIYNPGDGTTIGAQPTFRFTAPDGFRSASAIADQSVSVFSVSKLNGGLNRRLITGTNPSNYLLGYWGGNEDRGFNGNWFGGSSAPTTDDHMYIHEALNNGNEVMWDGDVQLGSATPAGSTAIGQLGFGGINWSGGETSNGDISEIIVFDSDMSQEDFDKVGLYLSQKYGFENFGHDGTVLGGGSAAVVPEPSTIIVWGVMLFALGLAYRRKRKLAFVR